MSAVLLVFWKLVVYNFSLIQGTRAVPSTTRGITAMGSWSFNT